MKNCLTKAPSRGAAFSDVHLKANICMLPFSTESVFLYQEFHSWSLIWIQFTAHHVLSKLYCCGRSEKAWVAATSKGQHCLDFVSFRIGDLGFDIFRLKFRSIVTWDRVIASRSSICFYFSFCQGECSILQSIMKNSVRAKVHLDVCPPVIRNLELLAWSRHLC